MMVKQATPVHVELTTVMGQDGQQERFHFAEEGQFVDLNGSYYLRYQEHQQGQATPVQFRLDNQELHLRRSEMCIRDRRWCYPGAGISRIPQVTNCYY